MNVPLLFLCFFALGIVLWMLLEDYDFKRKQVLVVWSDAAGQWWWKAVVNQKEFAKMNGPFNTRSEAFDAGRLAVFGKLKGEA